MNRRILIGLVALLATNSLLSAEQPAYKPGVVLVRFANDPNATAKSAILNSALGSGGSSVRREYTLVKGLTQVSLPTGVSVESAVASLRQSSSILYAEPDYRIELCAIPNDTRFGELWGMRNIGQGGGTPGADISAPEAWDISTGDSDIIVAVIDSGVDYTHPDLAANMWVNPGEIPGNGIDDDLDGYIDDVYGCDTGDNDGDPMDDSAYPGHGTRVSGTIGAVGNNALGVTGVCWHVNIMAVKMITDAGTETTEAFVSNAVEGIQYATAKGARVINTSWALYDYSQILYDTIAAARNAGVLFITAAGNENNNNDSIPPYPASYDLANIISVMATTNTDQRASYSNYGLMSVDLGAPGGGGYEIEDYILSTYPGGQYTWGAGTSIASPHVAGACALLLSIDPTLTYSQVKQILLDTVDPTLPGLCLSGGRLNLAAAAQEVATDTTPPTPDPAVWSIEPKATGRRTVTMEALKSTDRSGVEYYFECVNHADINSGWEPNTLYSFKTLSPGTIYSFRFRARDKSANHNQTEWSTTVFTMTASGMDTLSPAPDPTRWAIKPKPWTHPLGIQMQAKVASDESTPVRYFFECVNDGTKSSGWQLDNTYLVTSGVVSGQTYYFRCIAVDAADNETQWSTTESVTPGPGSRKIHVAVDSARYPTIQSGIDAANSGQGDIVEVSPGIYTGPGNYNIDFHGKAITVTSLDPQNPDTVATTVVDCQFLGRGFIFNSGEGPDSILAGLTIINGLTFPGAAPPGSRGLAGAGGGIQIGTNEPPYNPSHPTIRNCVINNCTARGGDGGDGANGADGRDYVSADPCLVPPRAEVLPLPGGNGGRGGDSGPALGGGIFCGPYSNPRIQDCDINACTVLPGEPGNGGNGGAGGDGNTATPTPPGQSGGNGGNGGNVTDVNGGGIYVAENSGALFIGCIIENCTVVFPPNAPVGLPGIGGAGGAGNSPGTNGINGQPGQIIGIACGGGAFYKIGSSVSVNISTTTFTNNHSQTNGGGIAFEPGAPMTATLSGCDFNGNTADSKGGGIWYLRGISGATLMLSNCTVTGNRASAGGGLFAGDIRTSPPSAIVNISGSSFANNDANEGGGVFISEATLTVTGSTFASNRSYRGGAINSFDCLIDISDSNITDNNATNPGGALGGGLALWNSYGNITNCVMRGNNADRFGGAVFLDGLTNTPLQFTNCLIADNNAYYEGGGLFCGNSGWAKLLNCTVVGNSATSTISGKEGSGGGISCSEFYALVEIENSILWDNFAAYGKGSQIAVGKVTGSSTAPGGQYADVVVSYSDVEGGEDQVFLEDPTYEFTAVWWRPGSFDADPLFASIDINEPTYYLGCITAGQKANSPCIDAGQGDASELESLVGATLTTRTDQVRDAGIVDIGYHYEQGSVRQYQLTIEVSNSGYGSNGRLDAESVPGSDNPFAIQAPDTITVNHGTVAILSAIADPGYRVQSWTGTDNDASTAAGNTVTMNSSRRVIVAFEPDGLYYLTVIVIGNGTVTPAGRTLHAPGEVITITATPANSSDVIIWTGTDNDGSDGQTNTVTMTGHRNVTVEFYTPRILHVEGNSDYTRIQAAIDEARDRDIIVLMPSDQPYYTQQGFSINGRNITITSINPNDPAVVASTVIQRQTGPDSTGGPAFLFQNVGPLMRLLGITIRDFDGRGLDGRDGQPPDRPFDGEHGYVAYAGGIWCYINASPTIENCVIDGSNTFGGNGGNGANGTGSDTNVVDIDGGNGGWPGWAHGGGMTCFLNSSPTLINCTFSNCSATGGNGGDGGNGNDDPEGAGGRGGGWYYGPLNPPPRPWFFGLPYGENPKFYSGLGGAVYIMYSCAPTFESCTFVNNTTSGGLNGITGQDGFTNLRSEPTIRYKIDNLGGAVYLETGSFADFNNCTFANNTADPNKSPASFDGFLGFGGAIAAEDDAFPIIRNSRFSNNVSDVGGGIYTLLSYSEVINSDFTNNDANHGAGLLFSDSIAYIAGSTFSGNVGIISGSVGGAIALLGTNAEIVDCDITDNQVAGSGGGIYISSRNVEGGDIEGDNSVLVKNCLITDNLANQSGGGISANWYSDPSIVNCTIVNNRSYGMGGGLSSSYGSFASVLNSIIWDNKAIQGSQIAIDSLSSVTVRFSDVNVPIVPESDPIDPNSLPVIRAGFDTNSLAANDDQSTGLIDIGFTLNFFGREYSQLFVNNNGNITFDANMMNFTPFGLTGNIGTPIIAPFFADVDTRVGNLTAYGPNTVDGHNAFGVTWTNVGYFATHTNKLNTFQMLVIDRSDRRPGDFDIEFNYESIQWETGDASGGSNGLGGYSAHAGFSNGTGNAGTFYEFPGSGVPGDFLDSSLTTGLVHNSRRSTVPGRYIFTVRGGLPSLLTAEPFYVQPDGTLDGFERIPDINAWEPTIGSNNINADPYFVFEGEYFLSQVDADQPVTSPCVDAGSDLASVLGLDQYTTRTDSIVDSEVVDMGYHYPLFTPPQYRLDINTTGPTLINPSSSSMDFPWYSMVRIKVSDPPYGYEVQWSGTDNDDANGTENDVLMNRNRTVNVSFVNNTCHLTVVSGSGGSVTVEPVAADGNYPRRTVVTLIADPCGGYRVKKWTGTDNDASYAMTNTVTMNSDKYVTVEFERPRMLTVPGDYTTIQSAISAARQGDTVTVASGVYHGNSLYIDKEITVTSTNPDDAGVVAATIIDSSGYTSPAIIFYSTATQNTLLDGFTIRAGIYNPIDAPDTNGAGQNGYDGYSIAGGAVYIDRGSSPTIRNCVIRDTTITGGNASDGGNADATVPAGRGGWAGGSYGGGVFIDSLANPTFINCTITNCTVTGGNAGNGGNSSGTINTPDYRDANYGGSWSNDFTFPWQQLTGSNGQPYYADYPFYSGLGGGVFCSFDSSATFIACNITNNIAQGGMSGIGGDRPVTRPDPVFAYRIPSSGGGVYCAADSDVSFIGCNITGNTAPRPDGTYHIDPYLGYGGGIAFEDTANIQFVNCNISDNNAAVGGGMFWSGGEPLVLDSTISGNIAYVGGGLYATESPGLVKGCTFSNNFAGVSPNDIDANAIGQGGGIFFAAMEADIVDCFITENIADTSGGGVYLSGPTSTPVLIKNCLFTDNRADRDGGAISANWYSDTNIVNCTIANNTSTIGGTDTGFGGGLYCSYNSYVNILNSIIWGNFATIGAQLTLDSGFEFGPWPSTADVTYSVIGPRRDIVTIEPAEALTINVTNDANVLASNILGPGINVVGQPQYTGADTAVGTFVGGLAAGIGIESGIILTSGDANLALPPNSSDGITGITADTNLPGDPDLDALLQARGADASDINTYDATVLEFSFTTRGGNLFFNFVFASDEYNEFTNSRFNDVFGFFLDGVNIALIPGTTTPVAINNVNGGNPLGTNASNPRLFHNNDLTDGGPFFDIEYDGFTNVFTAQALNVGSGTHTIKLAIADTADRALDSAVFIQAGSFSDKPSYSDAIYVDANCTLNGWDSHAPDPNNPWAPGTHNLGINANPLFVDGYFLSQIAAGQLINSPCVDAGSADVNAVDMNNNTTRTDGYADAGIVDMGYHYPLFTAQQYSLTIEVNGVGGRLLAQGKGNNAFIIKDPNTLQVNAGTVVSLQALADAGYAVSRWTGTDNDASFDPNNTVTMDSDKVVKVEFHQYQLTIEVLGADGYDPNGYLVATGTGADPFTLQARGEPNSREVSPGRVVNLQAFPDDNFRVRVWMGTDNDASTALTNTVTMNSDKTVVVGFEPNGLYYLTVTVIGNGTVEPIGRYLHTLGDVVTLIATPDNPADAIIWTGTDDDYSTARQNTVTMNGHKDVTVEFYAPRVLYVGTDPGYPTIQLAIDAANNRDIVMITPGIYNIYESSEDRPYLYISGKDIKLTSTNPEDANATQIIGGFIIENASRNLIIEGLTISAIYWKDYENGASVIGTQDPSAEVHYGTPQNAGVDGYGGGTCRGAGMQLNDAASPTVRNCRFVNCVARGWHGGTGAAGTGTDGYSGNGGPGGKAFGGGAYCGQGGSPLFEDCLFINCSARAGDGGNGGSAAPNVGGHGGAWGDNNGIWWDEWKQLYGAIHPLEEYWKYSGYGGAVYCDMNNTAEFRNCTFIGNSTIGGSCGISGAIIPSGWPSQHYKIESFGGAVYAASGSAPQFVECNFTNNEANMQGPPTSRKDSVATVNAYPNISFGGAVAFEDDAAPVFEKCIFNGNRATVGGGAFAAWAQGTVSDCNFEDNSSYHGGGILFVGGTGEIVNSRFTGNQSTVSAAQGGAITLLGANAEVSDCNIWDNASAGSGGGIYISSRDVDGSELPGGNSVLIRNCLIIDNSAGQNGAGISTNWHSNPYIVNCTIAGNSAMQGMGGGLYSAYNNYAQIINSILWDNTAQRGPQIAVGTTVNPAYMKVSYSDVGGGVVDVYLAPRTILEWDVASSNPDYPTNIHIDPCFISGPRGEFYLSQVSSGQPKTSPCVDAGSDSASALGFRYYTTRTDEVPDGAIVDMGYHSPLLEPCRFVDLEKNGIIDLWDIAIIISAWMHEGCGELNSWCDGADISGDTRVNFIDYSLISVCWNAEDLIPPQPNPSQWEIEPRVGDNNSVNMRVIKTQDVLWGFNVEYYFKCESGGCHDSDWQTDQNYNDGNLMLSTEYGYKVKARDTVGNETEWSLTRYVTTGGAPGADTNAPKPDPMTWFTPPYALSDTSVAMVATTAIDASGAVYYQFAESNGTPSDWQTDPCYVATGLDPNIEHCYTVRARDRYNNYTAWSSPPRCVSPVPPDSIAPSPEPIMIMSDQNYLVPNIPDNNSSCGQFETNGNDWWHKVMVNVTGITDNVDGTHVEIRFICLTDGRFSSTSKISGPIYLDGWARGDTGKGHARVTYIGTDYVVYDVDIDKYGGQGKTLNWEVCVNDATMNTTCSDMHTLGPP